MTTPNVRSNAVSALVLALFLTQPAAALASDPAPTPWRDYAVTCADALIEFGTDHYGPVHTAMFMSIIDPATKASPADPLFLDTTASRHIPGAPHGNTSQLPRIPNSATMLLIDSRVHFRVS